MKETSASNQIITIGLWSQVIALFMGIGLHTSAILAGRSVFFSTIFTPALDLLFVPFIAIGGLLGIWGYFRDVPRKGRSKWLHAAGVFVSVYFIISTPFHIKTVITWSTDHFTKFPERYSMIIVPIQILFLWIVCKSIQSERARRSLAHSQAY